MNLQNIQYFSHQMYLFVDGILTIINLFSDQLVPQISELFLHCSVLIIAQHDFMVNTKEQVYVFCMFESGPK